MNDAPVLAVVAQAATPTAQASLRSGFEDAALARNDDGSSDAIDIGFMINFFGTEYTQVYVNNNGNITFSGPLSTYTPFGLLSASVPIIAPFFADVDTRPPLDDEGMELPTDNTPTQYGHGTVPSANPAIGSYNAFGATWRSVGYYGRHDEHLNSFQVIIIERGDIAVGDFDIEFNYTNIVWEAGTASGGNADGLGGNTARAGFSNGSDTSFELPGSDVDGALINGGPNALVSGFNDSDARGRYRYKVRNGAVTGAIITVNSTRDLPDNDLEDNRAWTGEELPDDGPPEITLRAALMHANSTPNLRETIVFDIPDNSPPEYANVSGGIINFVPATPLPTITNPVVISGNDIVRVTGSNISGGGAVDGFVITSGSTELNGLIVSNFSGNGVTISGGTGNELYNLKVGVTSDGSGAAGNGGDGILVSNSSNNTIGNGTSGNVVSSNSGAGIRVVGGGTNVIDSNVFGVGQNSTTLLPNAQGGVLIDASPGNTISNNLVSGNSAFGVRIQDSTSTNTLLFQNTIGTNLAGAPGLGNQGHGIHIVAAPGTTVGGANPNVIAGNAGDGIRIEGATATGTVVSSNQIGTNVSGATGIGNQGNGVYVMNVAGTTIGGAGVNVISANGGDGVLIEGHSATGNIVSNNLIGTDASGSVAMGNTGRGVRIQNASGNTVGGATRNVISGNAGGGVAILGVSGNDLVNDAGNNTVTNNLIGTDASGSQRLGNNGAGIEAQGAPGLKVGGAGALGNTVAANSGIGIDVYSSANAIIAGNYVGTNSAFATTLGNGATGISILDAEGQTLIGGVGQGNVVGNNTLSGIGVAAGDGTVTVQGNYVGVSPGGTAIPNQMFGIVMAGIPGGSVGGPGAGEGNTVAHNANVGVVVHDGTTAIRIQRNSIYDNGGLGIDLGYDGVTANDIGDGDAGANNRQNFPILNFRLTGGVEGELRSAPSTAYTIEFFSNDGPDSTNHGEGKTFLGAISVTTDATGLARFDAPDGQFLTATATDPLGNTSEFSPVLGVGIDLDPLQIVGDFELDTQDGKFKADGLIQVGLKPKEGEEFKSIISVNGHVEYDTQIITATGTIMATIYDVPEPLFSGEWSINVGEAITSALDELNAFAAGEYELGGVRLDFEGFQFVNPDGGNTHDGRIELRGKAKLPDILDGVEIAITGADYIGISAAGVSFTGVNLNIPQPIMLDLGGFELEAANLKLRFDNAEQAARFGGTFTLPQFNTTIDFDPDLDRFFRVKAGPTVDFVGVITVDQPIPLFGEWSLENLVIEMNTTVDDFHITGTTIVRGFEAASFPTTLSITPLEGVTLTATSGEGEDFKVWLVSVDVTEVKLLSDRNPGNGDDFEPQLSFAGNLRLPTQLIGPEGEIQGVGDLEFLIGADNPLTINGDGVSLQQGILTATGEWNLKLFNITPVTIINPTIEFNTAQQFVKFTTTVKFPSLNNAVFDFAGDEHYVKLSRDDGLQVVGDIEIMDPINITSDGDWTVNDVKMTVDTLEGKYTGSAKIKGPEQAEFDLSLSLTPTEGLMLTATTEEGTDFTLYGVDFDVRSIEFTSDRTPDIGASDWDPELRLAGKLTLPVDLTGPKNKISGAGDLEFEIPTDAPLKINTDGLTLDQASLVAMGTWTLDLFEVATVVITDPRIEINGTEKYVKFQTQITFPNLNNTTFDFSGADNYVKVSAEGVQVIGEIVVPDPINITSDGSWAISDIRLTVNTVDNKYTGSAKIKSEDRQIDASAEITVENFTLTVATTPPQKIELIGMEVTLSALTFESDRNPGDLIEWDPQLTVQGMLQLPESFGDVQVTIAENNGLKINSDGIEISGAQITLPNEHKFVALGLLEIRTLDASLALDLDNREAKLQGTYTVPSLNDFQIDLSGERHLTLRDTDAGLTFAMNARFTIDSIPIYQQYGLEDVEVIVEKPFEGAGSASGMAKVKTPDNEIGLGLEFAQGRVTSVTLTTDEGADFTLLDSEIDVRKLTFRPDRNLTNQDDWEPQVEFQGSVTLPEALGSAKLDILDPNLLTVNEQGLDLTGGKLTFPDIDFNMLGLLEIRATALSLEYVGGQSESFKIQGRVNLPTVYDATADFAGTNYIKITSMGVEVVGTLSAEDIVIVPNVWEIPEARLTIDTTLNKVEAEATITIPTGIDLIAGLGFINASLNFASLGVDNLNKPIGTTGAFLQRIQGQVDHMAEADPLPIEFGGSVGVTAGPQISINLPSWAGGGFSGSLARLDMMGTIDAKHLLAEGSLVMVGGLIHGNGDAELNWDKGFLKAGGTLTALSGLITTTANFRADTSFNVNMNGSATVTIPQNIRIIGGRQITGGNMAFVYRNDSTSSNDYVAGWGTLDLPIVGPKTVGLRVYFDGNYTRIGGADIDQADQGSQAQVLTRTPGIAALMVEQLDESAMFNVPAGADFVLLEAAWENVVGDVPITLMLPDGTVLTEADIAQRADISLVDDLATPTSKVVLVASPTDGSYTIAIPDTTGLGQVTFDAMISSTVPAIELTEPSTESFGPIVTIGYNASDSDSDAQITLFYDDDATGFDGVPITDALVEMDGAGVYQWDTRGLPAGDYYVYAVIDDGVNAPVTSEYATGVVHVEAFDLGTVTGMKFDDVNGNHQRDANEPGLAGWTIYVDRNGNGAFDFNEPSAVTGLDGSYVLENVPAGMNVIREVVQPGATQTFPLSGVHQVSIDTSGQVVGNIDFGNFILGRIGGLVYDDANGNGMQDAGELGAAGRVVFLDDNANGTLDAGETSVVTAADGSFDFTSLTVGSYTVVSQLPDDYELTAPASVSYQVDITSDADQTDLVFAHYFDPGVEFDLGIGRATSVSFVNGDGTTVTLTISGGDALAVIDGDVTDQVQKGSTIVVTGSDLVLRAVTVDGSDAKSRLTITTKGGSNTAAIGDITVNGPIGAIEGKTIDLLGDLTTGPIKSIKLRNVIDDHTITITSAGAGDKDSVSLEFAEIVDLVLMSQLPIKSLKAASWIDTNPDVITDVLVAPSLGKLDIRGDKKTGNLGAFEADLVISGTDPNAKLSVGSVKIAGPAAGVVANITGDVGSMTFNATVADSAFTVMSDVKSFKTKGAMTDVDLAFDTFGSAAAASWTRGSLTASYGKSVETKGDKKAGDDGDITDVTMTFAGLTPGAKAKEAIGKIKVAGSVLSDNNATGLSINVQADAVGTIEVKAGVERATLALADAVKSLKLGDVTQATVTAGSVGSIDVVRWLSGDIAITDVKSLKTKGTKTDAGDFGPNLTVNAHASSSAKNAIGSVAVKGTLSGAWIVTGVSGAAKDSAAGKVTADAIGAGFTATFDGDVGSVSSNSDLAGAITANAITKLSAKHDARDLVLTLNQLVDPANAKVQALGTFDVKHAMERVTLNADGNVGTIKTGLLINSQLFAGVAAGVVGLPTSADQFSTNATIKKIEIKGDRDTVFNVVSSNMAAAVIDVVIGGPTNIDNGGVPFGMATTAFKAITIRDVDGTITVRSPEELAQLSFEGDAVIRLL